MAEKSLRSKIKFIIPEIGLLAVLGTSVLGANYSTEIDCFLAETKVAYQKIEPYLKEAFSGYQAASMLAFGLWDSNYKPYFASEHIETENSAK